MTLNPYRCAVPILVCVSFCAAGARPALAQALPAPWTNRDIGAPPAAGSAVESAGNFTVRGAGYDIWLSTDQFHFVSQPVTGDVDIRAYVTGLQYIHPWTKAGVMIRETIDPRSRHASTFVTPGKGLVFQRRVLFEGASTSTPGGAAIAPYWVRVVRVGQLFTSYVSPDGSSWTLVGSETISMAATVQVGLAVVSKDPSQTAMASFTNVTVNGGAITPPPASAWSNRDIGSPALTGRASESSGTFSVTGAGTDIWYASDQFHFMYQPIDGDVEVIARVNSIGYAHAWSKGGVMIREALTPSAAHAFMTGTAAKGWAFQRRPLSGSQSVHSPGSFTAPPGWVRLVRSGDLFSAYESADGSNWTIVGTETIPMPRSVYVGLAVTSHNATTTSTVTFTNVRILRPVATNAPPTATLLAPAHGTQYTAPATITFSATASDTDGTITGVAFYASGQLVGSDATAPYSATWSSVAAGTYNLTAVATDDKGTTGVSATATVTVNVATLTPTTLVFNPSPDHATSVTSYSVAIYRAADPVTAAPAATKNLGKPAPVNNEISVDISSTVNALAAGSYYAVVSAIGAGGTSMSLPSAVFIR